MNDQTQTQAIPTDLITARNAVALLGYPRLNGHNLRVLMKYGVKPVASIPWAGHKGGMMHLVSKDDVLRAKPIFEEHQANLKRRHEEKAEKERVRKEEVKPRKDNNAHNAYNAPDHMAMMRAAKAAKHDQTQTQTQTQTQNQLTRIEAKLDALLAMWE